MATENDNRARILEAIARENGALDLGTIAKLVTEGLRGRAVNDRDEKQVDGGRYGFRYDERSKLVLPERVLKGRDERAEA